NLLAQIQKPAPVEGQPPPIIRYAYDPYGRVTQVTLPDNSVQTSAYYLSGELQFHGGSQLYPVGYAYDAQGRVTDVTNWTAYPTSYQVTHYVREANSGRILSIQMPDKATGLPGQGVSFTYYPEGRVQSKTLARSDVNLGALTTSYAYNPAGDLATESF